MRLVNIISSFAIFTLGLCTNHIHAQVSGLEQDSTWIWGAKQHKFTPHTITNLNIEERNNGEQYVVMGRAPYVLNDNQLLDSIYLNFDSPFSSKTKVQVLSKNFILRKFSDSNAYTASFEIKRHHLSIQLPNFIFLNQSQYGGNFTIYFMIRPHTLQANTTLLSKMTIIDGKRYGLIASLQEDQIQFIFWNIFQNDSKQRIPKVQIISKYPIKAKQFHKVMLIYQSNINMIFLYIDDEEVNSTHIYNKHLVKETNLTLSFPKWHKIPLIIGKNFLGAIDEFILSNQKLPIQEETGTFGILQEKSGSLVQRRGIFLSQVYAMPYSQSQIKKIHFRATIYPGTKIETYIRFSDRPFVPDLSSTILPFHNILVQQKQINNTEGNYTFNKTGIGKGKYVQWQAILFPDPVGSRSPILEEVTISFLPNTPPKPPKNLRMISSKNGKITLQFTRNIEKDVLDNGRYHIYYGIKPHRPVGVIRYKDPTKGITFSDKDKIAVGISEKENVIQLTISNQLIQANKLYVQDKPLLQYPYPFFKQDIPLYVWITACDNAYSENLYHMDHESLPSNRIIVRPK